MHGAVGRHGAENEQDGLVQVMVMVCIALFIASLVEALPDWIRKVFPHSVLVLMLAVGVGLSGLKIGGHFVEDFIDLLEVSPEGIQLLFLPPLIFSEMSKTNFYVFLNVARPTLLLALPGVVISSVITSLFPMFAIPMRWSWYEALAFGGMLASTDPVAVISVLTSLHTSKRLTSIISGESVMNDGSSIILVTLFLDMQAGHTYTALKTFDFVFRYVIGSVVAGVIFGSILVGLMPFLNTKPTSLVTLTLAAPYLTFAFLQSFGMSGVLGVVPLGLMTSTIGQTVIVGEVSQRMTHFWEMIEFIANSTLFVIAGLLTSADLMSGGVQSSHWLYLLLLYGFVMLARYAAICILYPFLRAGEYGLRGREAVIAGWGGLRGAVGLTLALVIRSSPGVSRQVGSLTVFYMGGIVVLNLLINATTVGPLVTYLGLQRKPNPKILSELERQFKAVAVNSMQTAGIPRDILEKRFKAGEIELVQEDADGEDSDLLSVIHEKRRHFLLAQQGTYTDLLERGIIPRVAWLVLMQSLDRELDNRHSELGQWHHVTNAIVVRFMLRIVSLSSDDGTVQLANFFRAGKLDEHGAEPGNFAYENGHKLKRMSSKALYILSCLSYAYLYAHERARASMSEFSSSEDALRSEREQLLEESLRGCERPAEFLNQVRVMRKDVLRAMKAHQLSTSLRWLLLDRAFNLKGLGLVDHCEVSPLLFLAEELSARVEEFDVELVSDWAISSHGNFEAVNDFYPFPTTTLPNETENRSPLLDTQLDSRLIGSRLYHELYDYMA